MGRSPVRSARAQIDASAVARANTHAIATDTARFTGAVGTRQNVTWGGIGVAHAVA